MLVWSFSLERWHIHWLSFSFLHLALHLSFPKPTSCLHILRPGFGAQSLMAPNWRNGIPLISVAVCSRRSNWHPRACRHCQSRRRRTSEGDHDGSHSGRGTIILESRLKQRHCCWQRRCRWCIPGCRARCRWGWYEMGQNSFAFPFIHCVQVNRRMVMHPKKSWKGRVLSHRLLKMLKSFLRQVVIQQLQVVDNAHKIHQGLKKKNPYLQPLPWRRLLRMPRSSFPDRWEFER